ncbi:MAG: cation-translocating P-type ATPase [Roseburia sp.]|nr:cation-translocating P-type ATPase [Roseburia sp.]
MKEAYKLSRQELQQEYGNAAGLSSEKANHLIEKYGENLLQEKKQKKAWQIFLGQFTDLLVIILLVSAVISMVAGNAESTIVILAVILLNAILGTVQYVKAQKSLDALKELSAPKAKVLRDGVKKEVASKDIVPGDVILLEAGDMVVADGRILENYSLQVNESSLTGESTNVEKSQEDILKDCALGDRRNMVFSGSLVTYGRAKVLVTATGMDTEVGKIAALLNDTREKKTPLQVSLDDFSKKLSIAIIMTSVVVFLLRIMQKQPVLDSLMFAVALAVAAIPEALSSIVTIVQAMGTWKMAGDNAIIKDLKAVESLGSVSVICSDKTGTLTQNKMTVTELYLDGKCMVPEQMDLSLQLHRYFLYIAILNNDSSIENQKEIGDPTETCLLDMARRAGLEKAGITEETIRELMPRMEEIPFDSVRKRMSTKYLVHGIPTVFTKGAVDVLLERTKWIATCEGVQPLTESKRMEIQKQNLIFSQKGLRVLAFAYRECQKDETLTVEGERDYIFVGLAAMMDPPREESGQAVEDAKGAGIRTIMITGDHKVTATAIAKQIGIYREGDIALTGQELDSMEEKELEQKLSQISVYARVSPENKIRIVSSWQKRGNLVAMTGDGVNDAPALKKADIGVAMGITGTEVAKDAASMILADDNFATILKAVLNGRNIYRNIQNAIQFLLSGNMAAILVVLYCSIMALDTPFEPVHLLFINLLTDSLPALAIGMEPADERLQKEKPRDVKKGILTKEFCARLLIYGALIAVVTQGAYYFGHATDAATASTMAFSTLTLARLFHGFNCRRSSSVVQMKLTSNKWSLAAFGLGTMLLTLVLMVPFLQKLFLVAPLKISQIIAVVVLAIVPTFLIQCVRRGKEIKTSLAKSEKW